MHRILFIASHRPDRSPSQRFRFEQYRGWLAEQGFVSEVSHLVTAEDDRRIYRPGHLPSKIGFAMRSQFIRARDLARADDFDIVFIHREALMTRGRWFERSLARRSPRVVFDFDDAIWMNTDAGVSAANRSFAWVKDPGRTVESVRRADAVTAGNAYLAEWAGQWNDDVRVIPTTLDTDHHHTGRDRDAEVGADRPIRIGWSGSPTTIAHFETAVDALARILEIHGERVELVVLGDGNYRNERLGVTGIPWAFDTEVADVDRFDIGIMPLPDDEWAKGKCGFKALLYMAFEIPAVVSPVGVNPEIVADGVNGLHASTTEEWVAAIDRLVRDAQLRRRLGVAGRRTVVERYSVQRWRSAYLELFQSLVRVPAASSR